MVDPCIGSPTDVHEIILFLFGGGTTCARKNHRSLFSSASVLAKIQERAAKRQNGCSLRAFRSQWNSVWGKQCWIFGTSCSRQNCLKRLVCKASLQGNTVWSNRCKHEVSDVRLKRVTPSKHHIQCSPVSQAYLCDEVWDLLGTLVGKYPLLRL